MEAGFTDGSRGASSRLPPRIEIAICASAAERPTAGSVCTKWPVVVVVVAVVVVVVVVAVVVVVVAVVVVVVAVVVVVVEVIVVLVIVIVIVIVSVLILVFVFVLVLVLLRFETQGFQFTTTKEYVTALQVIQEPKSRYTRA